MSSQQTYTQSFTPVQISTKPLLTYEEWCESPAWVRDRIPPPLSPSLPPPTPSSWRSPIQQQINQWTTSRAVRQCIDILQQSISPPIRQHQQPSSSAAAVTAVAETRAGADLAAALAAALAVSAAAATDETNVITSSPSQEEPQPSPPPPPSPHPYPTTFFNAGSPSFAAARNQTYRVHTAEPSSMEYVVRSPTPHRIQMMLTTAGAGDIVPSRRTYLEKDIIPKRTPSKPIRGPAIPWRITSTARRQSKVQMVMEVRR